MRSSITPVKRLKDVEMRGLILTEFLQPPSSKVPRHFHDCATILLTLKGVAADTMTGRIYECKPSNILIRPAGEAHTHHYGTTGLRGLVIEVKPQKLETIRSFSQVLDRAGSFYSSFLAEMGTRLYIESLVMDSASELAIEGLVLEIIAHITRQHLKDPISKSQPRWLKQAIDFIEENYSQNISLSQIAGLAGVHATHLAEIFRKYTGCSIGQYIRRLRIDYAVKEVIFSEASLAEISVEAGFYDQSHFTKFFKRQTGISPTEMRAIARTSKAQTKSLCLPGTN